MQTARQEQFGEGIGQGVGFAVVLIGVGLALKFAKRQKWSWFEDESDVVCNGMTCHRSDHAHSRQRRKVGLGVSR